MFLFLSYNAHIANLIMLGYFTDSQLIYKIIWLMPQKSKYGLMALYTMIRLLVDFYCFPTKFSVLGLRSFATKGIIHYLSCYFNTRPPCEQWGAVTEQGHRQARRRARVAKLCGKTMGVNAFVD